MNVQLYVYDLSNGLARSFSLPLAGVQIDAIYHTSIVMEGIEYVYDGGVQMVAPGKTHLGRPMQIMELGKTELPMDVILDYIESMKEIYTFEAYDVFTHNCNNFTNDLATFLLGIGIPEYITNLPHTVLDTPFGRAIKPEVERMVNKRRDGQGGLLGIAKNTTTISEQRPSLVRNVVGITELDRVLAEATRSCAVIFFTSSTCSPCKALYPMFDEMADESGHKAFFIKVDVSRSYDIATKYNIRATPTFMTFLHGQEDNRWSGAAQSTVRGNIELLITMAWPPHVHSKLPLPTLRSSGTKPILYHKVPPLEKLKAKMGKVAEIDSMLDLMRFISHRKESGAAESKLPDLDALSKYLRTITSTLPVEALFPVIDLLRVAMVDPRFSGYYAEEREHKTIAALLAYVNSLRDCPYPLRLVTLQMACNLFSSPLYPHHILSCSSLNTPTISLITGSLLDVKHHSIRVAAASLAFNVSASNSVLRTEQHLESLPEEQQIELAASLLEAISTEEESPEALKGFLLAFGYLVYCVPPSSELADLLKSMDAQGTILGKSKSFPSESLLEDIGESLLS